VADVIELVKISKSYDGQVIFNEFSAKFVSGEPTLITGPSGRGKTTLLRLISGLENADGGEISTNGAKFAVMFQEPRLFPSASALDNVRAVAKNADYPLADAYFEKVGLSLDEDGKKMPSELSGGMKQRVSLARFLTFAHISGADALLLDEPFSALDGELKEKIAALISEISRDKILVVVAHDTDEAQLFGARVIEI
jgi:ABC-type nitrate/sulfonate/bicarbonate transport system ATPase subunit